MFKLEWENDFLFAENYFGKAECLVCQRTVVRDYKFFIERHYRLCHSEYDKLSNNDREELLRNLKKPFYEKMINDSQESQAEKLPDRILKRKASFVIAAGLAKRCRPFEDGMFYKELSDSVLECFGEKGAEMRKLINDIPVSSTTITRRTENISAFIYSNIKDRIINCKYFSLCLDEYTDITDICQLMICVRTIDNNFEIHEEMLTMVALHGNVKGNTIFDVVNQELSSFADKNKFCSVCTDGAKVMVGKKEGFVGYLLKNGFNLYVFHCIIHQQALFTKNLNLLATMQVAIKVINKIRGGHNSLTHRKFKNFLDEIDAEYGDLLMHTEVRWLSKGRCLDRLFNLRKEVLLYFESNPSEDTKDLLKNFKDNNFLQNFAFLTDMTELINQLNLQLQGRNKNIFELVFAVQQFKIKIDLLISQLKNSNLISLKRTSEIFQEFSSSNITEYVSVLENLLRNYSSRFHDFNKIENMIELHDNPLLCNIENQTNDIKEELLKMRADLTLPLAKGIEFWKYVNEEIYPKTKNEIYKLYSMFGSTYICESSFSLLKLIKSNTRNKLTDEHVENLIRIKCCPYKINIDDVMQNCD